MKATVDRNGCIGCGLCAEICPDVFDIADDGLAEAVKEPTRSNIHKAHEAAGKPSGTSQTYRTDKSIKEPGGKILPSGSLLYLSLFPLTIW